MSLSLAFPNVVYRHPAIRYLRPAMVIAATPVLLGLAALVTGELTVGELGIRGGGLTFLTALSSIFALFAVPILLILAMFRPPAIKVDHEKGTVRVHHHHRPIADLRQISVWDAGNPNRPLSINFVFVSDAFNHRFDRSHRGSQAIEVVNSLRRALPFVRLESFLPAVPAPDSAPSELTSQILRWNTELTGVGDSGAGRATDTYEENEFSRAEAARFQLMRGDPDETGMLRQAHDRFAADAGFPRPPSTFPHALTLTAQTGASSAAQAVLALTFLGLFVGAPIRSGMVGVLVEEVGPPGWPILFGWLAIITAIGFGALAPAVSTFRPDTVTLDIEGLWVRRWFRSGERIPIIDISSARVTGESSRRSRTRGKRLEIRTPHRSRAHRIKLSMREPDRIRQFLSNLAAAAPHAVVVASFVADSEMRNIRFDNQARHFRRLRAERRSAATTPPES